MVDRSQPKLSSSLARWLRENRTADGWLIASRRLAGLFWEFLRDSVPDRRRRRYGDVDYDWDYRVDTTSATVGWRSRLLGMLHSPYQATDPHLFREMIENMNIDLGRFVFVDIGSGKGRALLMAAEYSFRRIIGIELLPELHQVAQENISRFKSDRQRCFALEAICSDAADFAFPSDPFVIYLFNPLPETRLVAFVANLEDSLKQNPRSVYVLYHNPLLEHVLVSKEWLKKIGGTHQYSIFATR
jgi:SAM-dependent methyltransferase